MNKKDKNLIVKSVVCVLILAVSTLAFGGEVLAINTGTFTSSVIDTGQNNASWGTFYWQTTQPSANTSIVFKVRTSSTSTMSDALAFSSCNTIATSTSANASSSTSISSNNCVFAGHRYAQYQASFSSSDDNTPSANNVQISYNSYPTSSPILTGSMYNTQSPVAILATLGWTEDATFPSGSTATISMRAGASTSTLASASWTAFTNASSGCSKNSGVVSGCSLSAIASSTANQYWQYKVTLGSSGFGTPTVSNVSVTYAANAPPDFDATYETNGASSTQIISSSGSNWGKVFISFSVRDIDGNTGTNMPNYVVPTFQYSTNGGSSWTAIATSSIATSTPSSSSYYGTYQGYTKFLIATSTYNNYTVIWTPPSSIATTTVKIRITVDDKEAALNTATTDTANFTLDTTNPSGGGIVFDAGTAGLTNSAAITITKATDLSAVQYNISDDSTTQTNPTSTGWVNISTATTSINWTFDSDVEAKTLKYQFRDVYGNTTATTTVSTQVPIPSSSFLVQDTSNINASPPYYDMYIGWQAASSTGFSSYKLEYATSTDNTTFGNYSSISDASLSTVSTNYYMHRNLNSDWFYRYRVGIVGTNGNTSVRSTAYITAKPDGVQNYGEGGGGSVATASKVENVVATQGSDKNVTVNYLLTDTSLNKKTNPSYEGYLFYNIGIVLPASAYSGGNLTVSDASKLQSSGYIQVNNEVLKYTSKAGNVLSGLTRGTWPTYASSGRTTRQNTAFFEGTLVWVMATSTTPISITNSTILSGQTGTITWNTYYETGLAGNSFSNVGIRVLIHDNQDAGSGPLSSQNDYSETGILGTLDLTPPTISFASSTASGSETSTSTNFTINLSKPYALNSSAAYAFTGTAVYGTNYTLSTATTTGTVSINARATSTNITATIINDNLPGANKTIIGTLSSPTNASLGTITSETYTIVEASTTPTIGFSSSGSTVNESTSTINIPVILSAASGQTASTIYTISSASSTAVSGVHYTLNSSGTLTINAGATSTNLAVPLLKDNISGPATTTLVINLSSPTNSTLNATSTYTLTISEIDATPTIGFSATSSSAYENITPVTIPVVLSAASRNNTSINYSISASSTAVASSNYTLASSGTLTIPAGTTSTNITATIINNGIKEATKTLIINLSNPSNATTTGANIAYTYSILDITQAAAAVSQVSSPSFNSTTGIVTVPYTITDTAYSTKTSPSYEGYVFYDIGLTIASSSADSITVSDGSKFVSSGYIEINNEVIKYTSKAGNVLSGLTRATWPTTSTSRVTRQNSSIAVGTPVWIQAYATSPTSISNSSITTGVSGSASWDTIDEIALAGASYSNVGIRFLAHDNQIADSSPLSSQSDQSNDGKLSSLDLSAPTIQFATSTASGLESVSSTTLTLNLSKPYALLVSSNIATSGTAVYGTNYSLATTTATIAARATSTNFTLNVISDGVSSGDKTAVLSLSNISNATVGTNSSYTYTIIEDDAPTLGFSSATSSGYLSQTTSTNIAVVLSATRGRDASVNYTIAASSTAVAGTDYTTPSPASITISSGSTTGYINIGLISTSTSGQNKTIILELASATNATLASSTTHTFTIINDNNTPPSFDSTVGENGIFVSQVSSSDPLSTDTNLGKVVFSFKVKDTDTAKSYSPGAPNYASSTFEYNIGAGYSAISGTNLTIYDQGGSPVSGSLYVSDVSYIPYTGSWDVKTQIPNTVTNSARVKITVDDQQPLSNTTSTSSATFSVDAKVPIITSFSVDANSNGLTVNLSDDNLIFYRMSNNADLSADGLNASSSSWITVGANSINTTSSWNFNSSSSVPTVYLQTKDVFGNSVSSSAVILSAPADLSFKDSSIPANSDYREYLYWKAYTMPSGVTFSKYEVYRSTNGTDYSLRSSVTSANTNYFIDSGLSSSTIYYYKLRVVDSNGNGSLYTSAISDQPDGLGGTSIVAPTISNVQAATVGNDWAKITWTTDTLSTSIVEYSANSPSYTSSSTDSNYLTSHAITLTGLASNTTYYYRVKSADTAGNTATKDTNDQNQTLTFTTLTGPVISHIQAIPSDKSATITWETDLDSNSYVDYSTFADLSAYSEVGSVTYVGNGSTSTPYVHSVAISGLENGTTYYYSVKSTGDGGSVTDDNKGSYYSFRTLNDTTAPVISNIATPVITFDTLVITWRTDEPATTQVLYGTASAQTPGAYPNSTEAEMTLSSFHTETIKSLSAETSYYYIVKAIDESGNATSSAEQSAKTTKTNIVIIASTAGGSAPAPAPKDTTAPVISNIKADPITSFDATVTFTTNEDTLGFVEYGKDTNYETSVADSVYGLKHIVKLKRLIMGTDYHFRIQALDKAGNSSYSSDQTFKTKYFAEQIEKLKTVENAEQFQQQIEESIQSILPSLLPPYLTEPGIYDITEDSATVKWDTNIKSFSSVLFATDNEYDSTKDNPYTGEVADTQNKVINHIVKLTGLKSNTKYHIMAKAFSLPQVVGKSDDITFITKAAKVQAKIFDIKNSSFRVVWSTDEPASSIAETKNIRTLEVIRKSEEAKKTYHEFLVENLTPGTTYEVKVFGYDEKGNIIESGDPITIITSVDVTKPKISNFKVDNALVPGRNDRIQTIISWITDEPANSVVYYKEGSGGSEEFPNKVEILDNYTFTHNVIITNLKPGVIYQIKIYSTDQSGNKQLFGPRTIITPRQGESIFDVIFKNFEDTFKFLRNVGQ